MKTFKLLSILLFIIGCIFITLFFVNRHTISSQQDDISDLQDKIQALDKKVSSLETEKKELEDKLANMTDVNRNFYKPNNLFQNNLSPNHELPESNVTGNGFAIVVYKPSNCDYFLLENASGYILAEWMGGNDPDVEDKISGIFNSFGTKDFYNQSKAMDSRLWIDDYYLSKDAALEKMMEKCN